MCGSLLHAHSYLSWNPFLIMLMNAPSPLTLFIIIIRVLILMRIYRGQSFIVCPPWTKKKIIFLQTFSQFFSPA